jgi:hypothetical protein
MQNQEKAARAGKTGTVHHSCRRIRVFSDSGKVSFGSTAAASDKPMALPVYPGFRKYPRSGTYASCHKRRPSAELRWVQGPGKNIIAERTIRFHEYRRQESGLPRLSPF